MENKITEEILIEMQEKGWLSDDGKDALIGLLMNSDKNLHEDIEQSTDKDFANVPDKRMEENK